MDLNLSFALYYLQGIGFTTFCSGRFRGVQELIILSVPCKALISMTFLSRYASVVASFGKDCVSVSVIKPEATKETGTAPQTSAYAELPPPHFVFSMFFHKDKI